MRRDRGSGRRGGAQNKGNQVTVERNKGEKTEAFITKGCHETMVPLMERGSCKHEQHRLADQEERIGGEKREADMRKRDGAWMG